VCWAVPAKVVEIEDYIAKVDFGDGAYKTVLIGVDGLKVGDIVLVHAGTIIGKVRLEELKSSLELYREMAIELAVEAGISREEAEKQVENQLRIWSKWLEEMKNEE